MPYLDEFAPLSSFDEFPIHQTVEPIRFVDTTDPRAFERYWFTASDTEGKFFLVVGFSFYPNLNKTDAYCLFLADGKQTNVRAHRSLGPDRAVFEIGPFHAKPVEPFKEWHVRLDENEFGLSFDIRWFDTKRAVFSRQTPPTFPGVNNGKNFHNWGGYETFGRIEGTVTLGDKIFQLDPAKVRGSRDHHWGTRNGVGGEDHALPLKRRFTHVGQWVEFGTWSIWGDKCLFNIGDEHTGALKVDALEHRLRFDPSSHHFIGGTIVNRLGNGDIREVHYEAIENLTAYLRCGMYSGSDGKGTPRENHHHGQVVGDRLDGESFDVTDPEVRHLIGGMEDHLCRVTCGDETVVGILECRNPVLYEMCRDGVRGYSLAED